MTIDGKLFPYKKKILKLFEIAEKVLDEDFSKIYLSINFSGEEEIKELNSRYRKIDKSTDVLSFPNLDKLANQKLSEFDAEKDDMQNLFLGDIVICKKIAYKQSKEFSHSKKREICFLALHGLLHLLGFDHIKEEDEKLMTETAEKILKQFGATR